MNGMIFLGGRFVVEQCEALQREHGVDAAMAAALRVAHSRAQDNAVMFSRWREVERLLALSDTAPTSALH